MTTTRRENALYARQGHDTAGEHLGNQFAAATHAKFAEETLHLMVDSFRRDASRCGNLFVRCAPDEQSQRCHLCRRHARCILWRVNGWATLLLGNQSRPLRHVAPLQDVATAAASPILILPQDVNGLA